MNDMTKKKTIDYESRSDILYKNYKLSSRRYPKIIPHDQVGFFPENTGMV